MSLLAQTPGMTDPRDERMQRLLAGTHKDMAHWAGTGPEGVPCHMCVHYGYASECGKFVRAEYYKVKAGQLKEHVQRPCSKFRSMTGVSDSRRFPPPNPVLPFLSGHSLMNAGDTAHAPGTGPEGQHCRDCNWLDYNKFRPRPELCVRRTNMVPRLGKKQKPVDPGTAACKYFEERR